jgi:hypothetical protein
MPISLVPPLPESEPSVEEQLAAARAHLAKVSSPMLDDLRTRAPSMKTSELVVWLGNPQHLMQMVITEEDIVAGTAETIGAAATMALADEIDRRLPVPA